MTKASVLCPRFNKPHLAWDKQCGSYRMYSAMTSTTWQEASALDALVRFNRVSNPRKRDKQ